jgi:LysM repeat protein
MTATISCTPFPPTTTRSGAGRSASVGSTALPNYVVRRAVAAVLVVIVLAMAAVIVGVVAGAAGGALADLGGRPAAASEVPAGSPQPAVHVAAPGDTLWAIADRYRGDVGRDRYIDALVTLNGGTSIQAGQAIRLP